jgi:hypothetical protein
MVTLGPVRARVVRASALLAAVMLAGVACSSGSEQSQATGDTRRAAPHRGPPTGTLEALVAPPRSYRPVFTGEAAAVERAFRARVSAFDHKDVSGALATFSRAAPPPSIADLQTFFDNFDVRMYRIDAIEVHGDSATVGYENAIVGHGVRSTVTTLLGQHEVWTREGGAWKGVSDVASTPGIPKDLAAVLLTLHDGQPPEVGALPDRDFAFKISNAGSAAKGLFVLGIPAGLDVATFIPVIEKIGGEREAGETSPFPDGVVELGATADVPAGSDGAMVFSDRLPKGRYLLVSRAAGDEHPLLANEYVDFTVR